MCLSYESTNTGSLIVYVIFFMSGLFINKNNNERSKSRYKIRNCINTQIKEKVS